jgi:hypothetical protein
MRFALLTGAGFSRNWGGWLANEAFEYLLGRPELDTALRAHLWKSKMRGGAFEDALAELQHEYSRRRTAETAKRLQDMQTALRGMFEDMGQGFAAVTFEPQNQIQYTVSTFLTRFDVIFTLNQDLLLEHHYLNDNIQLSAPQRWGGWQRPGLRRFDIGSGLGLTNRNLDPQTPDAALFTESTRLQPYFKLHGSINWVSDAGERLLILGGRKALEINQHPILRWYQERFEFHLMQPETRLMVIGYSFNDAHINSAIIQAANAGSLKLFIIDPLGLDVLDKSDPRAMIRPPVPLVDALSEQIIGASRRPLTSTFGQDRVEHAKIMRFFAS